ncbi:MAG: hypothetical protein AAF432_00205 [Planctomycetota bacterium]
MLFFTMPAWIGLRGLCNLLDGMIAVEGGLQTRSGAIFNEFPDRIADSLFFLGAGMAARGEFSGVHLGWAAALMAAIVAYVRVLGASAGARHDFRGPMAKTHRMAILAIGCVAAGVELIVIESSHSIRVTLGVIVLGCLITIGRRLRGIVRSLDGGA